MTQPHLLIGSLLIDLLSDILHTLWTCRKSNFTKQRTVVDYKERKLTLPKRATHKCPPKCWNRIIRIVTSWIRLRCKFTISDVVNIIFWDFFANASCSAETSIFMRMKVGLIFYSDNQKLKLKCSYQNAWRLIYYNKEF